jgi:Spy/CpxP family protein refolding chaperone
MKRVMGWTTALAVVVLASQAAVAQGPDGQPQRGEDKAQWGGQGARLGGPTPHPEIDRMGFLLERLSQGSELAKKIGLSEEQQSKLRDGMFDIKTREADLRADLEKASLAQAKLMTEKTVDEKVLMAAVEKTGAVRTEMAKLRIKGLLLLKQTLTPEQMGKAQQVLREHFKNRPGQDQLQPRNDRGMMKKRGQEHRGDQQDRELAPRPPPPPANEPPEGPEPEGE